MITLDALSYASLNYVGMAIESTQLFSGSSGGTLTITPTLGGVAYLFKQHWVLDTAQGIGSSVSVQIFYQYNGTDRIRWSSIFSELIIDEMSDDFGFSVNGANYVSFGITLGSGNIANGYVTVGLFYN